MAVMSTGELLLHLFAAAMLYGAYEAGSDEGISRREPSTTVRAAIERLLAAIPTRLGDDEELHTAVAASHPAVFFLCV